MSPGCAVAVVLWLAASAGFGLYAAHFASYDKVYGTLAGVVVFLTWLWITNLALLLGLEVDAELERQRAIAAGLPPDAEPYLRLRDDSALPTNGSPGLADRSRQPDPAGPRELPTVDDGRYAYGPPVRGRRPAGSAVVMVGFFLGLAAGVLVATTRHRGRSAPFG